LISEIDAFWDPKFLFSIFEISILDIRNKTLVWMSKIDILDIKNTYFGYPE